MPVNEAWLPDGYQSYTDWEWDHEHEMGKDEVPVRWQKGDYNEDPDDHFDGVDPDYSDWCDRQRSGD